MDRHFRGSFTLENQDLGGMRTNLNSLKVFHKDKGLDLLSGEFSALNKVKGQVWEAGFHVIG